MVTFCADVREWLKEDEKNIVAVHCKGGKGRTGTMICTWLIHTELFDDAEVTVACLICTQLIHDTLVTALLYSYL